MSLTRVGPIVMDHRNPALSWTSGPSEVIRGCAISGQSSVVSVQQLSELVANPDRRITIGQHTGVLEYVHFEGSLVGTYSGWYLLGSVEANAERPWSVTPFSPFSLSGAYLGDAEVVVTHSWRQIPNTWGWVAVPAVYDPFLVDEYPFPSRQFVVAPSSAGFVREADEDLPHDVARNSEPLT